MFHSSKSRLDAISDGVFAVVLTIMVLDIKAPSNLSWQHLGNLPEEILTFFISFAVIGQYWIFHQELFSKLTKPTTKLLILNLFYLCFVCLMPFATSLLNNDLTARFNTTIFALVVCLVDSLQFILFHQVIGHWQAQGQSPTKHDLQEYHSAIIMFGFSIVYLLVGILWPLFLLPTIALSFLVRTIISRTLTRKIV